ncbi:hypothetical protein SAMD00019534_053160 [Acytostelium subglobosum LB1]|uniref:hypothetical protein n=1 Tax=Acytostelium subglobosum LB1 TaxID=1410327 RepID=UPI0006448038|nr:hypothetical protein SAMD00019534_053160 [Acytostelium subglobosum LB1]GAM22141.1 hypothetical protein SAMD00019534_053160 [Acytostelium subglobosum LB1]|eukprot:XP_012755241.1 hypothetical protein SAMD00019534_053160 [Acytostelium subglobosum LB1]
MDTPPANDSMFYSPTFKRYESISFYANLLSILRQYSHIVDKCPSSIRRMVWTHVFQLLGQEPRPCDMPFTPVINAWLGEKSVDLMDIETYFAAFTQAQMENAKQFPALPPVQPQFSIPGLTAPSTSVRVPKNQLSMATPSSTASASASGSGSMNSSTPSSPSHPVKQTVKQQSKATKQQPLSLPQPQPQQQQQQCVANQKPPSVWSTDLPSVLSQLALLQTWSPSLSRFTSKQRDLVWKICCSFKHFTNYDKSSLSKTIYSWTVDPIPNMVHITILFSALGYLKENGAIPGDFNYNESSMPVFEEAAASGSGRSHGAAGSASSPMYDLSSDDTPDSFSMESPPSSPRPMVPNQQHRSLSPSQTSSTLSSPGTPFAELIASPSRNNNTKSKDFPNTILSMSSYSSSSSSSSSSSTLPPFSSNVHSSSNNNTSSSSASVPFNNQIGLPKMHSASAPFEHFNSTMGMFDFKKRKSVEGPNFHDLTSATPSPASDTPPLIYVARPSHQQDHSPPTVDHSPRGSGQVLLARETSQSPEKRLRRSSNSSNDGKEQSSNDDQDYTSSSSSDQRSSINSILCT